MVCRYEWSGHHCRNRYTEIRHVPLPNGDHLAVGLCEPHAHAYDALVWAENRRSP